MSSSEELQSLEGLLKCVSSVQVSYQLLEKCPLLAVFFVAVFSGGKNWILSGTKPISIEAKRNLNDEIMFWTSVVSAFKLAV